MTMFNEEAEQALDEYIEETTEARREEAIIFYEGCTIVTAPTGPPPEYLTVAVDTINDPNVMWRGVPPTPAVGDEVIVWENPLSHRREIWGGSGATGITSGVSWCQVVVVAKCGGDFNDITDAIAWINALAAPPAANLLYVLYVLAGNWIEGANVTVPSFVTLRGMGDGTSIEMGAFDLIMSDDSNLFDVKVTFAASGTIDINNADRIILEHVHGTQSSNDDVLWIRGNSSDITCKDCWFESTGNEAVYVEDDVTAVLFDNCRFEAHSGTGYALVIANWAVVTTLWCQFEAYVPIATYNFSTLYHFSCQFDLSASTLLAGSHTALSTKRFNQTLVVAEAGGEFTSLGAAITYINAQGDAAAGKLYGVLMLAGNFAEAGNITIPQYVSVIGMGEGTEIEMGANSLLMSDDSSLQNVVVESSNASYAIGIVAKDNVILRNVRAIQTGAAGTPDCFHVSAGSTNVYLYDCVGEVPQDGVGFHVLGASTAILHTCTAMPTSAYSASTYGFQIGDTAVATLDYCIADDGTNFADGLHLDNAALTCTTRWCTFIAADEDVNVGAAATWQHFMCQFDPDNSTIAGTETPLVTGKANFDDVVYLENGFTMDGLTTQNIITIPTALAVGMTLVDTNAIEYLMIDTAPQLVTHFNRGGADVDHIFSASGVPNAIFVDGATGDVGMAQDLDVAGHVAIGAGAAIVPTILAFLYEVTTAVAGAFQGIAVGVASNPGAVSAANISGGSFTGSIILGNVQNHTGILYGGTCQAAHSGTGQLTSARGFDAVVQNLSTGTIVQAYSFYVNPVINVGGGAVTVGYGIYIGNQTAAGTNYSIYADGGRSYHVGTFAVGGTNSTAAQLYVDQSAAGGAIPVALFDQADLSEEFFEFTTTVGAGNPIDTAGIGAYYGKVRVMVTGVGYKVLPLYEES